MSHNEDVERFLTTHGIRYRLGTSADGPELEGEPVLTAEAILQLAQLAHQQPDLEQQSESIYRLLTWATKTGFQIQAVLDQSQVDTEKS